MEAFFGGLPSVPQDTLPKIGTAPSSVHTNEGARDAGRTLEDALLLQQMALQHLQEQLAAEQSEAQRQTNALHDLKEQIDCLGMRDYALLQQNVASLSAPAAPASPLSQPSAAAAAGKAPGPSQSIFRTDFAWVRALGASPMHAAFQVPSMAASFLETAQFDWLNARVVDRPKRMQIPPLPGWVSGISNKLGQLAEKTLETKLKAVEEKVADVTSSKYTALQEVAGSLTGNLESKLDSLLQDKTPESVDPRQGPSSSGVEHTVVLASMPSQPVPGVPTTSASPPSQLTDSPVSKPTPPQQQQQQQQLVHAVSPVRTRGLKRVVGGRAPVAGAVHAWDTSAAVAEQPKGLLDDVARKVVTNQPAVFDMVSARDKLDSAIETKLEDTVKAAVGLAHAAIGKLSGAPPAVAGLDVLGGEGHVGIGTGARLLDQAVGLGAQGLQNAGITFANGVVNKLSQSILTLPTEKLESSLANKATDVVNRFSTFAQNLVRTDEAAPTTAGQLAGAVAQQYYLPAGMPVPMSLTPAFPGTAGPSVAAAPAAPPPQLLVLSSVPPPPPAGDAMDPSLAIHVSSDHHKSALGRIGEAFDGAVNNIVARTVQQLGPGHAPFAPAQGAGTGGFGYVTQPPPVAALVPPVALYPPAPGVTPGPTGLTPAQWQAYGLQAPQMMLQEQAAPTQPPSQSGVFVNPFTAVGGAVNRLMTNAAETVKSILVPPPPLHAVDIPLQPHGVQ